MNFSNILSAPASEAVLEFNPMNFISNLQYMGIGMLTIFIIIGVIILATALINKASK